MHHRNRLLLSLLSVVLGLATSTVLAALQIVPGGTWTAVSSHFPILLLLYIYHYQIPHTDRKKQKKSPTANTSTPTAPASSRSTTPSTSSAKTNPKVLPSLPSTVIRLSTLCNGRTRALYFRGHHQAISDRTGSLNDPKSFTTISPKNMSCGCMSTAVTTETPKWAWRRAIPCAGNLMSTMEVFGRWGWSQIGRAHV